MPNHVHVLIETFDKFPLGDIVHSWKSFTAKAINRHLQREGTVWHPDYHDRHIRDDAHLYAVIDYIESNPLQAGLVARKKTGDAAERMTMETMRARRPRSQEGFTDAIGNRCVGTPSR